MSDQKWPPIDVGTTVKTTEPNLAKQREWTAEAWAGRQWGVEGPVVRYHDSHGLSYKVRHPDGTIGNYDPSELELVGP